MTAVDLDLYEVLQVHPSAHPDVVSAAYRRLAQLYHPDKSPSPEAHDRMKTLNLAWAVLKDPDKRAAYDRRRSYSLGDVERDRIRTRNQTPTRAPYTSGPRSYKAPTNTHEANTGTRGTRRSSSAGRPGARAGGWYKVDNSRAPNTSSVRQSSSPRMSPRPILAILVIAFLAALVEPYLFWFVVVGGLLYVWKRPRIKPIARAAVSNLAYGRKKVAGLWTLRFRSR